MDSLSIPKLNTDDENSMPKEEFPLRGGADLKQNFLEGGALSRNYGKFNCAPLFIDGFIDRYEHR